MIGIVLAAQLAIAAHAADTVRACQPLQVTVDVSAPGTASPTFEAPSFAPFDVLRVTSGPTTASRAAAGAVTTRYRYVLVASAPGRFTIPSFAARLGRSTVRSRALSVLVMPSIGEGDPAIVTRARMDNGDESRPLTPGPDTVFVGQQADYSVAVFLNAAMRERLPHNPTFYPPDMQSVLAYDVAGGNAEDRSLSGSRCFDALVYRRALFPLEPGRIVIPPAQLTYSMSAGASFFSQEQSHDMQTDSAVIIAVNPPTTGQPAGYDGAVGAFRLEARLQSTAVRVGDALTVTVRVSGTGNVRLLPRPRLRVAWATAVPADERVEVDTSGRRIGGVKEFDWVLTPRVAGRMDLPAVQYDFFDPWTRRYETASSRPLSVSVLPGSLAPVDTARAQAPLALRPADRGPIGPPLSSRPEFWLLLAAAPLPALVSRWRRRRRVTRVRAPAARLADAVREDAGTDASGLRRTFVAALADRLQLDAETFTAPGALRHALRRAGVSPDAAEEAERLLRALDTAAFAPGGAMPVDAPRRTLDLMHRVDREALPRGELPFRVGATVVMAMLVFGGTARGLQDDGAAAAFRAGVTAYAQHAYLTARDAFAHVAAVEPRNADAWADFGTAAWAAGDTADAVVGWRRALGLEPLAGDVRSRLALVHSVPPFSPGYVAPAPLDLLLALMAIGWLVACAGWHPVLAAKRRWVSRLVAPGLALALLGGLGAVAASGPLSGHALVVVRSDTQLANDPALGTDRGAMVDAAEMARVQQQQGAWMRIRLDGGRQGWLPVNELLPLDTPLPPPVD